MKYIIILFTLLFSGLSSGQENHHLFSMNFSMHYEGDTFNYNMQVSEGTMGLIVKVKSNGVEKRHYIQTIGKQYIIARTPKDLIDRPLFLMYRVSSTKYKIQYPINMNDSNWDKFIFSVKNGSSITEDGQHFENLKVGKTIWDRYWGVRVPVGIESLGI